MFHAGTYEFSLLAPIFALSYVAICIGIGVRVLRRTSEAPYVEGIEIEDPNATSGKRYVKQFTTDGKLLSNDAQLNTTENIKEFIKRHRRVTVEYVETAWYECNSAKMHLMTHDAGMLQSVETDTLSDMNGTTHTTSVTALLHPMI